MRRVRYSVAVSLDGYIAGPGGEFDWIPTDPDMDFTALFESFDVVIMGRATYDVVRRMGQAAISGKQTYVFSRTLSPEDCPGVTVSADAVGTVAALRAAPGKDIWLFGGGELFRVLLDAGQVDAVEVAIAPVLLGGGVQMLPPRGSGARLRLVKQRVYEKTGIVKLDYEVSR